MSDKSAIQDVILDKGKEWISKPENKEKAKSWGLKAWSWIKGKFSKK